MQGAGNTGTSDFDTEDLIIPRVTLLQGISPVVMAGEAANAHFYHTIMNIDMGDALDIVPILYRKQYTLWNPLHMGGGVIARATDGRHWDADFDVQVAPYKDMPKKLVNYKASKGDLVGRTVGLGAWGSADPDNEDAGPAATLSHVFMMRAVQFWDLGPFIVFLQRSSERTAREFMSMINGMANGRFQVPMWGQVFALTSKGAQNNAGQEYNQYAFKHRGFVQDAAIYDALTKERQAYEGTRFRTNDEDAQAEDMGAAGGGGGAAAPDSGDDKY